MSTSQEREVPTVLGLENLIASRAFLTSILAGLGIAIAFGPEIRLAVGRIRHSEQARAEDLSTARASIR